MLIECAVCPHAAVKINKNRLKKSMGQKTRACSFPLGSRKSNEPCKRKQNQQTFKEDSACAYANRANWNALEPPVNVCSAEDKGIRSKPDILTQPPCNR